MVRGKYPVVSQSEELIEGYSNSEMAIQEVPLVLFGDHTCCVKLIDFPFVVGADGTKLLKSKVMEAPYLAFALQYLKPTIVDGKYRRHFGDLMERFISLPPLAIQRRIAAKLDRLCDIVAKRKDQLSQLNQLVKSRFVEMFGDPMTNPNGWPTGRVSDLAKYWNGLTYKPENVTDTGTIVLRSSNIQGGSLDFADIVRVNISAKEKNLVAPGDVLMCSRNGSAALVGKTAIIPKTDERMYFGAFMMILRSEVPEYLNAFFATKAFRSQIACGATSTVNQITCTMMDNVSLPLPPKDLMREFAAFVEKVDKLAFAVRKSLESAEKLYRQQLSEAFT